MCAAASADRDRPRRTACIASDRYYLVVKRGPSLCSTSSLIDLGAQRVHRVDAGRRAPRVRVRGGAGKCAVEPHLSQGDHSGRRQYRETSASLGMWRARRYIYIYIAACPRRRSGVVVTVPCTTRHDTRPSSRVSFPSLMPARLMPECRVSFPSPMPASLMPESLIHCRTSAEPPPSPASPAAAPASMTGVVESPSSSSAVRGANGTDTDGGSSDDGGRGGTAPTSSASLARAACAFTTSSVWASSADESAAMSTSSRSEKALSV